MLSVLPQTSRAHRRSSRSQACLPARPARATYPRLLRFEASHGRARTSRDGWPQLRTGVALQGGQALAFDLPDGGNREERSLAGKVSGR